MIFVAFMLTPIFALIGNYIAGLTDWNLVSNFAKLAVLIFGSWAAKADPENAVVTALLACGIVYCGASYSTDIIGDLVTGFLTRTSPKAMIIAQLVGFVFGCFICPAVFFLFYSSAPDIGFADSKYPNSYGAIYRGMALLGSEGGFDSLPKHCLTICYYLFAGSFILPALKMLTLKKLKAAGRTTAHDMVAFWWPAPMAAGIPFIAGTAWVLPTGIGLCINQAWKYRNAEHNKNYYEVVAAGILVGVGIWSIPEVLVALAGLEAPGCFNEKPYVSLY